MTMVFTYPRIRAARSFAFLSAFERLVRCCREAALIFSATMGRTRGVLIIAESSQTYFSNHER